MVLTLKIPTSKRLMSVSALTWKPPPRCPCSNRNCYTHHKHRSGPPVSRLNRTQRGDRSCSSSSVWSPSNSPYSHHVASRARGDYHRRFSDLPGTETVFQVADVVVEWTASIPAPIRLQVPPRPSKPFLEPNDHCTTELPSVMLQALPACVTVLAGTYSFLAPGTAHTPTLRTSLLQSVWR